MTKDDIIRMAREAGLAVSAVAPEIGVIWCSEEYPIDEEIYRFAELVAAAERNRIWTQDHWTEYERSIAATEREWCAEFLLSTDLNGLKFNHELQNFIATLLLNYATAIRARGQS